MLRSKPRVLRFALATLAVASAIGLACGGSVRQGRVLLIGIDGATLRVAAPLMRQGRLPNLSRIAREGVFGPLRSVQPLLSPRIWNSIATGKTAHKHGILNFTRKREDGTEELLLSTDRKVPALWNIASNAGLTVAVVNWWNTFPPDRIRGVMVSDHLLAREIEGRQRLGRAAPPPTGAVVFPEDWQPRLRRLIADEAPPIAFDDPFLSVEGLPTWVKPQVLSRRYSWYSCRESTESPIFSGSVSSRQKSIQSVCAFRKRSGRQPLRPCGGTTSTRMPSSVRCQRVTATTTC
jgi:hypothetical protein